MKKQGKKTKVLGNTQEVISVWGSYHWSQVNTVKESTPSLP